MWLMYYYCMLGTFLSKPPLMRQLGVALRWGIQTDSWWWIDTRASHVIQEARESAVYFDPSRYVSTFNVLHRAVIV